jgi:predicted 2-oxoglutarate/Fe(II)-dependent dioxygenase YbiX
MKYETGAKIHPHTDHIPNIYGSISFNLNNDYEGGEFKFFNGNYTVSLNKGDALIFPADYFWVHEVTPVTKGERYSINSFLYDILMIFFYKITI